MSANERGLCVTAGIGLAVVSTTQAAERGQKRHAGINALNPLITWSVTHKTTVPPQKPYSHRTNKRYGFWSSRAVVTALRRGVLHRGFPAFRSTQTPRTYQFRQQEKRKEKEKNRNRKEKEKKSKEIWIPSRGLYLYTYTKCKCDGCAEKQAFGW